MEDNELREERSLARKRRLSGALQSGWMTCTTGPHFYSRVILKETNQTNMVLRVQGQPGVQPSTNAIDSSYQLYLFALLLLCARHSADVHMSSH